MVLVVLAVLYTLSMAMLFLLFYGAGSMFNNVLNRAEMMTLWAIFGSNALMGLSIMAGGRFAHPGMRWAFRTATGASLLAGIVALSRHTVPHGADSNATAALVLFVAGTIALAPQLRRSV